MKKRIIFIQLPPAQFDASFPKSNLPLAAGYLTAYALKQGLDNEYEFIILQDKEIQQGSDSTIINLLMEHKPDIISASLYCWNLERTLYILGELHQNLFQFNKDFSIILGGPEVTEDNIYLTKLLKQSFPNEKIGKNIITIIGEGEIAFTDLLLNWGKNIENIEHWNNTNKKLLNLTDLPSPYLLGLIKPQEDYIALETLRGCPFDCAYCYYPKNYSNIRYFPENWLSEHLEYANKNNIKEISFLDPSFTYRKDLKKFLETIKKYNKDKHIKISLELCADRVDEELAFLLADCGVVEIETGLQSIHQNVLEAIGRKGRKFSIEKFTEGIKLLQEYNITVRVDLIAGLPEDNYEQWKCSLEYVYNNKLDDYIQIFQLAILPATQLRNKKGLVYQEYPPYLVLSTPTFNEIELHKAFTLAEEIFDIDLFPIPLPDLVENRQACLKLKLSTGCTCKTPTSIANKDKLINKLIIELDNDCSLDYLDEIINNIQKRLSNINTLWFKGDLAKKEIQESIYYFLDKITILNKYTQWEIFLESNNIFSLEVLEYLISAGNIITSHYLNRTYQAMTGELVLWNWQFLILLPLEHNFAIISLEELEQSTSIIYTHTISNLMDLSKIDFTSNRCYLFDFDCPQEEQKIIIEHLIDLVDEPIDIFFRDSFLQDLWLELTEF